MPDHAAGDAFGPCHLAARLRRQLTLRFGGRICVVGAAETSKELVPAKYTSSGPSATGGRRGPDCSAVTEEGRAHWGVVAAGTFGGSMVRLDGTSVAAPQLVRYIANIFARTAGRMDQLAPPPQRPDNVVPTGPRWESRIKRLSRCRPMDAKAASARWSFAVKLSQRVPRRRYPANCASDADDDLTINCETRGSLSI